MVKWKKKTKLEFNFLGIRIDQYSVSIGASINYEVRDKRYHYLNAKVFKFDSHIEIEGTYTYPDDRAGQAFQLTIYGSERKSGEYERTLSDYQERDEERILKYRKVRGKLTPVYDVPNGIGYLEYRKKRWSGAAWVSPRTVSDMLALLPNVRPLYISIHEAKEGRHRRIVGLTLQTTDPANE